MGEHELAVKQVDSVGYCQGNCSCGEWAMAGLNEELLRWAWRRFHLGETSDDDQGGATL